MFISMKYGPNTPMGRKLTLGENQTGTSAHTDADTGLIGQAGTAHTLLRPSGTATISGKRLDVVAESGIIERGSPVKVVAIQENKIIVRKT
jgi:membrane-bound serine protease (ClpP class)